MTFLVSLRCNSIKSREEHKLKSHALDENFFL